MQHMAQTPNYFMAVVRSLGQLPFTMLSTEGTAGTHGRPSTSKDPQEFLTLPVGQCKHFKFNVVSSHTTESPEQWPELTGSYKTLPLTVYETESTSFKKKKEIITWGLICQISCKTARFLFIRSKHVWHLNSCLCSSWPLTSWCRPFESLFIHGLFSGMYGQHVTVHISSKSNTQWETYTLNSGQLVHTLRQTHNNSLSSSLPSVAPHGWRSYRSLFLRLFCCL